MVSQVRDRCNMCAGRCREPRRKGTWVADLSGCIVPWAARASCWPQPQQLLPVSAAGSGRRCCTGAFLPAGLFGGSMLFESTRSISLISSQNKNLSVLYMLRLFGGRGWITRAALLKTAHWAVFTLSSATAPQLFESTLAVLCRSSNKTETPASSQRWSSWWARVDYASRASKKAPQGLFSPPDYSAGRCCSNPPA